MIKLLLILLTETFKQFLTSECFVIKLSYVRIIILLSFPKGNHSAGFPVESNPCLGKICRTRDNLAFLVCPWNVCF